MPVNPYNLLQVIYTACLAATCLIVWRSGRAAEWIGVGIMVAGSVATVWANSVQGPESASVEFDMLLIDLLVLSGFVFLVLKSDRFWPLWACGIHLVSVATHLVMLFYPTVLPQAYRVVLGFWAYPVMAAVVVGALDPWRAKGTNAAA